MTAEVLTVAEMAAADKFAALNGVPTLRLMEEAGHAVATEIARRWTPRPVAVFCGRATMAAMVSSRHGISTPWASMSGSRHW